MANILILGSVQNSYLNLPCVLFFIFLSCSYGELYNNSFTVSSFSYPETKLLPYESRYIRVKLPPWFSSMSIALESNADLDYGNLEKLPKSTVPILCLRDGGLPLPDSSDTSLKNLVLYPFFNQTFGGIRNLQNSERCYPMQKNISMQLTNEQISPGIWYIGLFNGLGPTRTQSKMINRGSSYSVRTNISIGGCSISTMSGPYCNQTVAFLPCSLSENINQSSSSGNIISCRNSVQDSCHGDSEPKLYSLEIDAMSEQLTIVASNIGLNNGSNASEISLICYARHGTMPLPNLHDYSGDINKSPLTIHLPKAGRWYITIIPSNISKGLGVQNMSTKACYSMEWRVLQCPVGKAGLNCSLEKYTLQTFFRRSPPFFVFESYYLPAVKASSDSSSFPLEPLSSTSSFGEEIDSAWTYFVVDIPYGASGGNMHVLLKSDTKINYEVYARYGGLPNLESFDYFYGNRTHNSNESQYFKLYSSSEILVRFYIWYAREGTWSFGLRRLEVNNNPSKDLTTMSISLERCPNRCSSHGLCYDQLDTTSGLAINSYCRCDLTHGGFDCGVELVTQNGHLLQSISLIASNAAAVFPAFWALRQRAFAEWVIFTCSGVSSGLYHACDVGSWCALSFNVLQFMDFWLSFVAVVSTFVHLTDIDEGSKRTIHAVVYIATALMAAKGPTRSSNIYLVISIGAFGLLIGWMLEFSTKYRSFCFSTGTSLTTLQRYCGLQNMKGWLHSTCKTIVRRFRWGFILAGFIALAMAATSWILESSQNYWIWHSMWHVSIYTSSFFFLCSKVNAINDEENQEIPVGAYELTRQDSLPRRVIV